jgi:hypothetical protein
MVFCTHITYIFPQKNCFVKNEKIILKKQKLKILKKQRQKQLYYIYKSYKPHRKNILTFPAYQQAGAEC